MQKNNHYLLLLLLVLSFTLPVNATSITNYPFSTSEDSERFLTLTKEIRCLVCQNQNIADSNAPLAMDLRKKVYAMILDKKSDAYIKNYMTSRFGDYILLKPPVNKTTIWLWLFPLCALIFIPIAIYRFLT